MTKEEIIEKYTHDFRIYDMDEVTLKLMLKDFIDEMTPIILRKEESLKEKNINL